MRKLLAITDRRLMGPDPLHTIRALADRLGPALLVQVRERDLTPRELHRWISTLHVPVKAAGAQLLVNDRADVARCFAPDAGVHLPERGLPIPDARSVLGAGALIGVSIHRVAQVRPAIEAGASLLTLAPIFETPGKGPALGLHALHEAVAAARNEAPVFALGGCDAHNSAAVWACGVAGIAAIRAAWGSHPEALLQA